MTKVPPFLHPDDVAHWGLKASGLRYLKDVGLYGMNATFVDRFESRAALIAQLIAAGLTEDDLGMSVRFSSRADALYQPHRWALRTYDAVADYIETNKDTLNRGTFIINNTAVPAYMGNLLKRRDGTYHLEMVPGTWITSGVEPTDYGEIRASSIALFVYQQPRRVLGRLEQDERGEFMMGTFVPRTDPPLTQALAKTLAERLVAVAKKLTHLGMPPLLYEFNMNDDLIPHVREVKTIDEDALMSTVSHTGPVYEIDQYEKLASWDGMTPLYLTVGVEKSTAHAFQEFVRTLHGRVSQVYVKYGVLTHPAILLREAGIQPISLRQQYRQYDFTF